MKSKALLVLPPVVILGLLIFHQSTREDRTAGPPHETSSVLVRAIPREDSQSTSPKIDWQRVAGQMDAGSSSGRIDENSEYGRFLKEVDALSGPQLVAAWEDLAATDLPAEARARFEAVVAGALVRTDVEGALTRLADQLGDPTGPVGGLLLSFGFREWALKFPAKAGLWLDARIEDGSLGDGVVLHETPVRVLYERELIRSLLLAGPDKAAARLDAMPVSWRPLALKGADSVQGQGAYARLVRKYFPEADQGAEFRRMAVAARYLEGSDGVANFLDRIAATPAERERILRETAGAAGGADRSDR